MDFDAFINLPVRSQAEKEARLLPALIALSKHHCERSEAYRRIVAATNPGYEQAACLADLPYLPASLFKTHRLQSISDQSITNVLTSSGSTGASVSRIVVDSETAGRQAMALTSLVGSILGPKRLPMIVVDCKDVIRNPALMSARGAGVLGMMRFGRTPFFALDDDMNLDQAGLEAFLERCGHEPFFMFGFTFVAWRYFLLAIKDRVDLSQGVLLHSGGWKKMLAEAVDNSTFKQQFCERTGLRRIHNFYGMVEQLGGVCLEGEDGFLHPPSFGDVIIRDPVTLKEAPLGAPGLIEILSLVPKSYPGHAILTEDIGVLHAIDDGAQKGKAFSVLGRAPKAELRGCSDVTTFKKSENRDVG